jgi:hypothetical protein
MSTPLKNGHMRNHSDLADFTMLEIERPSEAAADNVMHVKEVEVDEVHNQIPKMSLVILADTATLENEKSGLVGSLTEFEFEELLKFKVKDWKGDKFYSDLIKEGLEWKKQGDKKVVMLFESPSSSTSESSFHNKAAFKFHDWPPPKSTLSKAVLGPCRYALMNGASYPTFLKGGKAPEGLLEHWKEAVPKYVDPIFVPKIEVEDTVYAYLPVEAIKNHINDPHKHYHLAGKDAIHLMTSKVCIVYSSVLCVFFELLDLAHTTVFSSSSCTHTLKDHETLARYTYEPSLCRQNDTFNGKQGYFYY